MLPGHTECTQLSRDVPDSVYHPDSLAFDAIGMVCFLDLTSGMLNCKLLSRIILFYLQALGNVYKANVLMWPQNVL